VLTCSSNALAFSPLTYLLSASLGVVNLLRNGVSVSSVSLFPAPQSGLFLGFNGSELLWQSPGATDLSGLSLSTPSAGVLELKNGSSSLSLLQFLPSPLANRVLATDSGGNLLWAVDQTGSGGGTDTNDFVSSGSESGGVVTLTRTDGGTVQVDMSASTAFYSRSVVDTLVNALNSRIATEETQRAQDVTALQASINSLNAQLQTLQAQVNAQAAQITALESKSLGTVWANESALYTWVTGSSGPGPMLAFQGSTPTQCKRLDITSVGNGLQHWEAQLTATHTFELTSWL